nr:hypothetical protein Iba_chr09aCG13510 [Ipomoea batatas]
MGLEQINLVERTQPNLGTRPSLELGTSKIPRQMHLGGPTPRSELGTLRRSKAELKRAWPSVGSWAVVACIVEALDPVKEVQIKQPTIFSKEQLGRGLV